MTRGERPEGATVHRVEVLEVTRPGPGFARVVLGGDAVFDAEFVPAGTDQWFRLFLPRPHQVEPVLPLGPVDGWHGRWRGLAEAVRPISRCYTVRRAIAEGGRRRLEVDFVLHRDGEGRLCGPAALWADRSRPGDAVGFLDMGTIFPISTGPVVVVADATGLPAVENIAAALRPDQPLLAHLGVEHDADRRELPVAAGAEAWWHTGDALGNAALAALETVPEGATVYAIGSDVFTRDAKARFQALGVPEERIDCCTYWRSPRVA